MHRFDDLAEADELSPCLMVGFNRRFSLHASAIREIFAGRTTPMVVVYRVNAGVVPPDTWIQDPEVGGGRVLGEVCHFVDFCESLIASEPVRVQAVSVREPNARHVEDSIVATIAYADGSLATIQYLAHGASALPKERCEVYADGMTAVMDNFTRTDFHGIKRRPVKGRQDKGFDAELSAFLGAAHSGEDGPIPLKSLLRTTRVTFAILDALRSGEAVDPRMIGGDEPAQDSTFAVGDVTDQASS